MTEIKFRAWDGEKMLEFALFEDWCGAFVQKNKCPVMQFTGL
jgi:hypothetical protein